MRIIFQLILIFSCILSFNFQVIANEVYQTKSLDLKSIEANIRNDKSKFYYDSLLDKFHEADSDLSEDDYTHIYYGYSFQEEYTNKRVEFFKHYSEMKDAFKKEDWNKLKEISELVLNYYPVNLDTNFYYVISLSNLNEEKDLVEKYVKRWHLLQYTVAKSGSGLSPDDPVVVISIEDEYHMMHGYFEFPKIIEQSCCDAFSVKPSEYFNSDKIYFDISQKLLSDNKLFK